MGFKGAGILPTDVTQLLLDWSAGDQQALVELTPLVYAELRQLAAVKLARENPGQTLQPTALVHEAWLRLAGENHPWANRRQFFSAAAEAMRVVSAVVAPVRAPVTKSVSGALWPGSGCSG